LIIITYITSRQPVFLVAFIKGIHAVGNNSSFASSDKYALSVVIKKTVL